MICPLAMAFLIFLSLNYLYDIFDDSMFFSYDNDLFLDYL